MLCPEQAVEPRSAYLLRQLNHPEIPGAQTVVSVDSPVRTCCVTLAVSDTVTWKPHIKMYCLPPQLKVLVHQLRQTAPVPVLQGRPEGGTFSVSHLWRKSCSNTLHVVFLGSSRRINI